jgi:hypothetical protein
VWPFIEDRLLSGSFADARVATRNPSRPQRSTRGYLCLIPVGEARSQDDVPSPRSPMGAIWAYHRRCLMLHGLPPAEHHPKELAAITEVQPAIPPL